jgi:hypothetical protein
MCAKDLLLESSISQKLHEKQQWERVESRSGRVVGDHHRIQCEHGRVFCLIRLGSVCWMLLAES